MLTGAFWLYSEARDVKLYNALNTDIILPPDIYLEIQNNWNLNK